MQKRNPIQLVIGAIVALFVLYLLYRLMAFLWWIGMFVGPILLIASLVINRRPLLNYIQMLGDTFWKSPLRGIAYGVLSLIGLPIVSLYIFLQAFLGNKVEKAMAAGGGQDFFQQFMQGQFTGSGQSPFDTQQKEGEYTSYEEVDTRLKINQSSSNDDLFKKYTDKK